MNDAPLIIERQGPLALVTLNRPAALNALTLPMIRSLSPALRDFAADDQVRAVVLRGAGERAFCAGGDVRAIYEDGLAARRAETGAGALTRDFFRAEYLLNRQIRRFPKPFLALLDGIVMGGGVGLSVHGSYRLVTDKTLFAMPETGIGFFPDVGATYVLSRLPDGLGVWLGLTGARLGAGDCLWLGLGTHMLRPAAAAALVPALLAANWGGLSQAGATITVIDRVLADLAPAHLPEPVHAAQQALIERCFTRPDMASIMAALAAAPGEFAAKTLASLQQMSPTALCVTLAALQRAASLSFADCLVMEYRLSQACMAGHDFYEGIRAQLVDKDRQPRWQPAQLADVTPAMIEAYFLPPASHDLKFAD